MTWQLSGSKWSLKVAITAFSHWQWGQNWTDLKIQSSNTCFLKPTLLKRKRNSLWKQTNTYMVLAVHCTSGWNWSFQSSNPLIIGQTGFLSFRRIIIGFKRTQRIFNGLKLDCSMCFTWILSYYRFNLITESPFQFDTQMSNVNGKGTLLWIWYIISLLTIVLSNNKNNITVSVPVTKFLWGLWGGGRRLVTCF